MNSRHVMIRASAGSGKTYALTNRYVSLLLDGAEPDRIVALTFTRKAAGEFFDEILNKLARAAADPNAAAKLARDLGRPQLGTAEFLGCLRRVVNAMHRLQLGTLDGFFSRIARAFPLELGLTGDFEVLQEHSAQVERRRVLQRMFARSGDALDAAQREFIEAFKRATFGTEEKRLVARLDRFLNEHQENFLAAPIEDAWGNPARIWPDGCAWLEPARKPLADAIAALQRALAARPMSDKQRLRWSAFFAALPDWSPGGALPGPVAYIVKNALAVWADLQRGGAAMIVERTRLALSPEECCELALIVRHIVGAELSRHIETTQGIFAVLRGYEASYHDAVRRAGKLTFGDVQRLLMPDRARAVLAQSDTSADGEESAERRLLIDFRLDAQFDHWLLDEFQDTSFGQWSVLRNLIDEAVQDPTGGRSFFCVGDVKQAIFTWREGDPRLFREILEHYNRAAPGTIAEEHLDQTWRCGPAVVAMVNSVFGRAEVLQDLFPGAASAQWNREWREHASGRPGPSHAAWFLTSDEEERFDVTLKLIREIAPLERGLECAVLTKTNALAAALADYLRREGDIAAIAESDLNIATDNPLGCALLALVQAAAHPGDTFAQEHCAMTPLRAVLAAEGIHTPETLTTRLLAQLHTDGFERTIEYWLRRLEPALSPTDEFSRDRGRQFVAAAALFDATGSRDVAEFVAFMERHAVRGAESRRVVRVMTIHKSKGLGFDVVIVPHLEGDRLDQRRDGLAVQRAPNRTVEWVLDLPPRLFHEHDDTLGAHVQAAEAEGCYEALSLLYVALTRAKRALYVLTDRPARTSQSRNYARLLASTLGTQETVVSMGALRGATAWTAGEADWYESLPRAAPQPTHASRTMAAIDVTRVRRVVRRQERRPSTDNAVVVSAAQAFALDASAASDFGTAVHALLARVDGGGAAAAERLGAAWASERCDESVMREVLACVRAPALADIWSGDGVATDVWCERPFEVVLGDTWVSGVFDRVLIERDARGRPRRATVIDFKTERVSGAADIAAALQRHASQLQLYRRVAGVLTGLRESEVEADLVFTAMARRVPLAPA